MSKKPRWDFRDVSLLLQSIRKFLLGRKHTLHPRFPTHISPRSIPTPDIPRNPDDKYSANYYFERNAFDSVKPPVVAPVAEGPTSRKPESVCLQGLPTPGDPWAWDGHRYFECVPDIDKRPVCPPPKPPPAKQTTAPCAPPPPPKKKC